VVNSGQMFHCTKSTFRLRNQRSPTLSQPNMGQTESTYGIEQNSIDPAGHTSA